MGRRKKRKAMLDWLQQRAETRSRNLGHELDTWFKVPGSKSREARSHCTICGAKVMAKIGQPNPYIEGETFAKKCQPLEETPPILIKSNQLLPMGRMI